MPRLILLGGFFLLTIYAFSARQGQVEVFEIGKHNVDLLPGRQGSRRHHRRLRDAE